MVYEQINRHETDTLSILRWTKGRVLKFSYHPGYTSVGIYNLFAGTVARTEKNSKKRKKTLLKKKSFQVKYIY